jgi:hypothetical protein
MFSFPKYPFTLLCLVNFLLIHPGTVQSQKNSGNHHKIVFDQNNHLISDSISLNDHFLFAFRYTYAKDDLLYLTYFPTQGDSLHIVPLVERKGNIEEQLKDTLPENYPDGTWITLWHHIQSFETIKNQNKISLNLFTDSTKFEYFFIREKCTYAQKTKQGTYTFYLPSVTNDSAYLSDRNVFPSHHIGPSENMIQNERESQGDKVLSCGKEIKPSGSGLIAGNIFCETSYVNGMQNGWRKRGMICGKPRVAEKFENDKLVQKEKYYPLNDSIYILETQQMAGSVAEGYYFAQSGSLKAKWFKEGYYKDNKRNGKWYVLNKDGEYYEYIYKNDSIVSKKAIKKYIPKTPVYNQ